MASFWQSVLLWGLGVVVSVQAGSYSTVLFSLIEYLKLGFFFFVGTLRGFFYFSLFCRHETGL